MSTPSPCGAQGSQGLLPQASLEEFTLSRKGWKEQRLPAQGNKAPGVLSLGPAGTFPHETQSAEEPSRPWYKPCSGNRALPATGTFTLGGLAEGRSIVGLEQDPGSR